ncbi:DUF3857 domain-containing protein [Mucilaginibacter flavidus]|uniref:DUF3857 domain-containing protein n=1 Tax=Mucilaginibacter flavidus TaxID=2949309 RepID=UPI0020927743|nr:DUF3857 domain-containing protein [Mucilaginibacter flavidus]MCO5948991.1 DUF3857 domain-containing protein [Mucilaginibacter flavidus]
MMRGFIIAGFLTVCWVSVNAQQNYDASLIPKELLPYASSVVRNEEVTIEVKDLDNMVYHVKKAITVLNKNGDQMANLYVDHDKSTSIKYIKGIIYNSFGITVKKISESDFDEANAWDGFSLFLDTKIKSYRPVVSEYPYTVVYEYEQRLKQTLYIPGWEPNPHFGVALEKSSYTFLCKPDFKIRLKEINMPGKVNISSNAQGLKSYYWQMSGIKAVKDEPLNPNDDDYLSSVKIAPEKFLYYGMAGSFTNYKELGKWEYDNLVAKRDELPYETIQYVKNLTASISDPKLKAKKIYEYMQSKTHYVSVQVGVGGWQPFLASDVDRQNYGDCKALVNYTRALLKAVNIESYYCEVEADADYKISFAHDFPCMQGNHIILCVPFKNDTTWADCTSQTLPFGYLGDFTDDRTVLAVTPEGGKLLHTPKYTVETNLRNRKADFSISDDGELSGTMSTIFKGVQYTDRDYFLKEPKMEQYKILPRVYQINNMDIDDFELNQDKSFDPATTEKLKLHARDFATLNDGKIYFSLNPINRKGYVPRQVRNRTTDVYFNEGYTDNDEITYTIPKGYRLEKMVLNEKLDKPFGNFTATMELKGDKLTYKRKFQLIGGTYNKAIYPDVVDFFQAVVDADEYNVVLVKSGN